MLPTSDPTICLAILGLDSIGEAYAEARDWAMEVGMGVLVRKAVAADAETIAAFNVAMAVETEGKQLSPETVAAGVASLLNQPHYGFYVVAEVEGQLAGCLLITFEWSDWRNGVIWWFQSVYVAPAFRRQGIFRQLYAQVQDWARQAGACGVRLYVEEANQAAQATYRSLGMEPAGYQVFEALF